MAFDPEELFVTLRSVNRMREIPCAGCKKEKGAP